jgi:hypothetical protein
MKFPWHRPQSDRRKSSPEEREQWDAQREEDRLQRERIERRLTFLEIQTEVLARKELS